jgi:16S rRNA processing protein RimM
MSARAQLRTSEAGAKADKASRSSPDRVCVGRVGGARGLKGEVRIRAFTRRARDIAAYGPLTDASGARSFAVSVVAETGNGVIARLSGIADRSGAERIKGMELFVARSALPPLAAGEFYLADLLGLAALDTEGRPLGRVAAIHDFGAGAILDIDGDLWPASVIAAVDLAAGKVVLTKPAELVARDDGRRRP